jgi:tetratricopeptide (TPR) repeat protein
MQTGDRERARVLAPIDASPCRFAVGCRISGVWVSGSKRATRANVADRARSDACNGTGIMNKALGLLVLLVVLLVASSCQSSMREPPPIKSLAPAVSYGRSADELVNTAYAAWTRRAAPGKAAEAQDAYLAAAAIDEHRTDALLGAMRAIHYRVEYESGAPKGALTHQAVAVGQWCTSLSPHDASCMYMLAMALGQDAREHPLEARDAVAHMIDLLHQAIAIDPSIDAAGPHRVLALVLLRAPSWPGPGDAEAGLDEARAAVAAAPDEAQNQLALGEALAANGSPAEAREAYRRAITLSESARVPEAETWRSQARDGLQTNS